MEAWLYGCLFNNVDYLEPPEFRLVPVSYDKTKLRALEVKPMEHLITVFTPTYNRAYTLEKCYNSLLRQTNKDFIWLVVDDGSTDDTQSIVSEWKRQGIIPIQYHRQDNQGMHGAHNTAYSLITTELCVCCDSDDYLADDAIEKILKFWGQNGSPEYSGIVALDAYPDGQLISRKLSNATTTTFDIRQTYRLNCDYKLVFRSVLLKDNPLPLFEGEKYVPLDCKYYRIDLKYKLLVFNEILCFVEYLPDGGTRNILTQYRTNPKGFTYFRKEVLKLPCNIRTKFRHAVHYVACSLILRNKRFIQESPASLLTLLATPLGIALFLYLTNTHRKTLFKG